jgi:glyoxylase-like metal-dependent hydrolase (beta-lactamase superfamily II)/rhodanese-related sulfurtransferase
MGGGEILTLVDDGLGNSSYLVDLGDGRAMVVDPVRDPRRYLAEADQRGLRVTVAAETHLHADFVSGSRELAARGARVVAAREAGLAHPHHGLVDGDGLDLGGLTLEAVATPGHTPEHLAYLLRDGRRPLVLFSGGSLLVGAVARTDLVAPERTEELARRLFRSVTDRLLALPDDLPVLPTHGAGSFCSAPAGAERATTIGRERRTNPLLAGADEDVFVRRLLEGLGSYPAYFHRLRELNRLGPRVYGEPPALPLLDVEAVRGLAQGGAEVVDVRPVAEFAAGHLPGSLSIPLRPQFASWLGWLVPPERPLVFVLSPGQDRDGLVRQCLGIGFEELAGELAGGAGAWAAAGLELARTPLVGADAAAGRPLLDVRQDAEFATAHVPGAAHVELGSLAAEADRLPPGALVAMCGHGERAVTAASLLARAGRDNVAVLVGGPEDVAAAWRRSLVSAD